MKIITINCVINRKFFQNKIIARATLGAYRGVVACYTVYWAFFTMGNWSIVAIVTCSALIYTVSFYVWRVREIQVVSFWAPMR